MCEDMWRVIVERPRLARCPDRSCGGTGCAIPRSERPRRQERRHWADRGNPHLARVANSTGRALQLLHRNVDSFVGSLHVLAQNNCFDLRSILGLGPKYSEPTPEENLMWVGLKRRAFPPRSQGYRQNCEGCACATR